MTRVVIDEAALDDLRTAALYYRRIDQRLVGRLRYDMRQAVKLLRQFPEIGRFAYGNVRRRSMLHFPYTAYYRVNGATVQVLAVLPDSQDPARTERTLGKRS